MKISPAKTICKTALLSGFFNKNDIHSGQLDKQTVFGETFILYHNKRFMHNMLFKTLNVKALTLDNIQATNEEVKMFCATRDDEGKELFTAEGIISSINENNSQHHR